MRLFHVRKGSTFEASSDEYDGLGHKSISTACVCTLAGLYLVTIMATLML